MRELYEGNLRIYIVMVLKAKKKIKEKKVRMSFRKKEVEKPP